MPQRRGPISRIERLNGASRAAIEAERCQEHWYRWLAERVEGCTVLDAGAGSGYGLPILRERAVRVEGFDLASFWSEVRVARIEDYAEVSWDVVSAVDVIEHVGQDSNDDHLFLAQMFRVARCAVFFSTPNWHWNELRNPHHVREYTPHELRALIAGRPCEVWVSGSRDRTPRLLPGLPMDAERSPNFGVWMQKR